MTPEVFRKRIEEIIERSVSDSERGHREAERLMCNLLVSLGYHEGVWLITDHWRYV